MALDEATLARLGRVLVTANTPNFVWRKFAATPSIQALADDLTPGQREDLLRSLLAAEPIGEADEVRIVAHLVALLLDGTYGAERASLLAGIDKVPHARGLIRLRQGQTATQVTDATLPTIVVPSEEAASDTSTTSLIVP